MQWKAIIKFDGVHQIKRNIYLALSFFVSCMYIFVTASNF